MRNIFVYLFAVLFMSVPVLAVAAPDAHEGAAKRLLVAQGEGIEEHSSEIMDGDEHHAEVQLGAEAGDHHEGEVQGLPQLDVSTFVSQIFWLAVMFALMYTIFRFKVIPDLSSVVERRREQIESDLNAAHNLKEEAEHIHNEYEAVLAEARGKSSALYTRVESKIKEKQQEETADFQSKSMKAISDAEAEIIAAKQGAMQEMNEVAAEIAALAVDKIVGVRTDKKNAVSIVESLGKKKAA